MRVGRAPHSTIWFLFSSFLKARVLSAPAAALATCKPNISVSASLHAALLLLHVLNHVQRFRTCWLVQSMRCTLWPLPSPCSTGAACTFKQHRHHPLSMQLAQKDTYGANMHGLHVRATNAEVTGCTFADLQIGCLLPATTCLPQPELCHARVSQTLSAVIACIQLLLTSAVTLSAGMILYPDLQAWDIRCSNPPSAAGRLHGLLMGGPRHVCSLVNSYFDSQFAQIV